MDAKLAEIYGTNKPDDADVEKLAAAELAEKLAGEEGVDLNAMSEEELEGMAQELLAGEGGETAPAKEEPETEDKEKVSEAQEKLAEADYLGRVMAHAYVQELREIEKKAAAESEEEKKKKKEEEKGKEKKSSGKVMAALKKSGKMVKKSSAMDTLVEARMNEILEQSGIDPASLKETEPEKTEEKPQEKTSSDKSEVLAKAVEERAWAELARFGVEPAPAEEPAKE